MIFFFLWPTVQRCETLKFFLWHRKNLIIYFVILNNVYLFLKNKSFWYFLQEYTRFFFLIKIRKGNMTYMFPSKNDSYYLCTYFTFTQKKETFTGPYFTFIAHDICPFVTKLCGWKYFWYMKIKISFIKIIPLSKNSHEIVLKWICSCTYIMIVWNRNLWKNIYKNIYFLNNCYQL